MVGKARGRHGDSMCNVILWQGGQDLHTMLAPHRWAHARTHTPAHTTFTTYLSPFPHPMKLRQLKRGQPGQNGKCREKGRTHTSPQIIECRRPPLYLNVCGSFSTSTPTLPVPLLPTFLKFRAIPHHICKAFPSVATACVYFVGSAHFIPCVRGWHAHKTGRDRFMNGHSTFTDKELKPFIMP